MSWLTVNDGLEYCVYIHTFPNGKRYIGITSQIPEDRWRKGRGYYGNRYLTYAIKKHGWENIKHDIIYTGLSVDEAIEKEIFLIAKFDSNNKNLGYNLSKGGESHFGIKHSNETKEKMRIARKGKYGGKLHPMYGKTHTDETKEKMSKAKKGKYLGENNHNFGVTLSEEHKKKLSIAKMGHTFGFANTKRAVVQLTLDNVYIEEFPSVKDAQIKTGTYHISDCCNGKRQSANGYLWTYKENYLKGEMKLKINLDLNRNFVTTINKLTKKYGDKFERINGFHQQNLNFTDFIDNFIDSKTVADVSIDANANSSTKDINTLKSDMTKPHLKLLSFNKIFYEITKKYGLSTAEEWLESEWNGDYYLHNATTSTYLPYCYAYDLYQIVEKGLYFIDKFKSTPAKHLTTYNDHVLEFISWTANRSSGAVGLPSYLVYSYYYWNNDIKNNFFLKDPEYYREQCFQKFIYDLNQPYLRVTECAFTNISIMDKNYLAELFGARQFPDGEFVIDHIDGIIEHQKVFMEVTAKIREKLMMTFPVLTYSLLFQEGKFVDEEFARWCNKHNMKWFDSNFYVGNDVTTLSNCCRLLSNTSKLNSFINSIGGTSLSVGSVQVNTTNLRRIALLSNKNKDKYINILSKRIHLSIKVLDVVRNIIKRNIEKGLLPNYTYGLVKMENQYNTLGITAMYEAIRDMGLIQEDNFGSNSYTDEGLGFATKILRTINEIKDSYSFDYSINVEAVPAERANSILCTKDNLLYPEFEQDFLYSNQWIPLMENSTIQEKIKLGAVLDKECGGGQILHVNLQGKFASEKQSWDMLNHLAKSGIIYFAYNVQISVCDEGHGFFGQICPTCGKSVQDVFSRIVGYLVPTQSYSKERKQEFDKRKWFLLD